MTTITAHTAPPVEPYLAHQGEARWYGDSLFEFLVPSEATGGKLSVFLATLVGSFSPPRHVHTREDEVFHVLDGDVTFELDGRRLLAGPGTSVFVPRGVPHTFRIDSPVARLLGVIAPGAFEQLFRNLSVPAGERALPQPGTVPLDIPAVMTEQARLGTEVVGPPLGSDDD
jgi:mannose-6-phosphate isomerase-like protein (cupin superfamily)